MDSLEELLRAACYEDAGPEAFRWNRLVLLRNVMGLPSHRCEQAPESDINTGFHVVVLGGNGRPRYYAKVGALHDAHLEREYRVIAALGNHPETSAYVPRIGLSRSAEAVVQICEYVGQKILSSRSRTISLSDWSTQMAEVLETNHRIANIAIKEFAEICGAGESIVLESEAAWALEALSEGGLSSEKADRLADVLRIAGEVPRIPQHGDLWSGNIMRNEGGWRLIDFATYGVVRVPLYDVLHCLVLALEEGIRGFKNMHGESWIAKLARRDALGMVARELIQGFVQRYSLSPNQVRGVMVFYIVDFAARIRRRGLGLAARLEEGDRAAFSAKSDLIWMHYFEDVVRTAEALERGEDLAEALART